MRLIRFQQRHEVYGCRQCGVESLLLDCHYCERRSVRQLPDSVASIARWACHQCQIVQYKCPACDRGWVVDKQVSNPLASGFSCQHCQQQWAVDTDIG
jgi:transposase-like protein